MVALTPLQTAARQAARAVFRADALLVTAGAGMGVDSGLPDFRGTKGLWKEYPPLKQLGLNFVDMANPSWFEQDPCFAWGFYGHRLLLYRRTVPHDGFVTLQRWSADMPQGHFAFTSNVDGQFQRSGFAPDRVVECHGSLLHLQGLEGGPIETASSVSLPEIDTESLRLDDSLLPRLSNGELARPNVLMFGDAGWDGSRTGQQQRTFAEWLTALLATKARLVVVEVGAGKAVPTVRRTSESLVQQFGGVLIRINPRDGDIPSMVEGISIPCGALDGLSLIDAEMEPLRLSRAAGPVPE